MGQEINYSTNLLKSVNKRNELIIRLYYIDTSYTFWEGKVFEDFSVSKLSKK
jgi:hypothetical protein